MQDYIFIIFLLTKTAFFKITTYYLLLTFSIRSLNKKINILIFTKISLEIIVYYCFLIKGWLQLSLNEVSYCL